MKIYYRPFRFAGMKSGSFLSLLILIGIIFSFLLAGTVVFLLLRFFFSKGLFLGFLFVFFLLPPLWRFFLYLLTGSFATLLGSLFSGGPSSGEGNAQEEDVIDVKYEVHDDDEGGRDKQEGH